MKKLIVFTLNVFSFLVGPAFSQTIETEVKRDHRCPFVTAGVVTGDGASATLTLSGGAEGLIKGRLGASVDDDEWGVVQAVPPGGKLIVNLTDGKTVEGKLSSVSETMLTLSGTALGRENILKVYRKAGTSVKKATLIGAAVGAAAGGVMGAAAGGCQPRDIICFDRSQTIPVGAAVGAGFGALSGFAIGKLRHKRVLIYEARQRAAARTYK